MNSNRHLSGFLAATQEICKSPRIWVNSATHICSISFIAAMLKSLPPVDVTNPVVLGTTNLIEIMLAAGAITCGAIMAIGEREKLRRNRLDQDNPEQKANPIFNAKTPLLVQSTVQAAVMFITAGNAMLSHNTSIAHTAIMFGCTVAGNALLYFKKDLKAIRSRFYDPATVNPIYERPYLQWTNTSLQEFPDQWINPIQQILGNPYLYWGVAFFAAGLTQQDDFGQLFLPHLPHAGFRTLLKLAPPFMYLAATVQTIFRSFIRDQKGGYLKTLKDLETPIILFGSGCAVAAIDNFSQNNFVGGLAMTLYSVSFTSFYISQKKGSVYDFAGQIKDRILRPKPIAPFGPLAPH